MKSTNKKILTSFSLLFAVLTLATAALRCAALFTCYDDTIGYYDVGAALPMTYSVLYVFAMLAAAVLPLLLMKKSGELPSFGYSVSSRVGSAFFGVVLLFGIFYGSVVGLMKDRFGKFDIFIVVFGLIGLVYFALVTSGKVYTKRQNCALFAYAFIVSIVVFLAKTYFDWTVPMNGTNKIMFHLALMSAMLYMLAEVRFIVGRPVRAVYASAALVCVYLCTSAALPGMVGYFAGLMPATAYFTGSFVMLAFSVYVVSRYVPYLKNIK